LLCTYYNENEIGMSNESIPDVLLSMHTISIQDVTSVIGEIMTRAACGAGNAYPSGAPGFTSGFHRGPCCSVICFSLFHVIFLPFGF